MYPSNLKLKISLLILQVAVLLFAGCKTTEPGNQKDDAYNWAYSLQEQVESVPAVVTVAGEPLAAPSNTAYMNEAWPWGAPQNLTRPINSSSSLNPISRPPVNAPGNATTGRVNQGPSSPVIVNFNQGQGEIASSSGRESAAADDVNSRMEGLYRGQFDRKANRELTQIGYGFFKNNSSSLETVGPVPGNYTMGPGDEISLSLSGGVEAYHKITVDRDGYLSIPEFGTVGVSGVPFANLHEVLMDFLEQRRHGFELTVSMGRLRKIQVNVVGRVNNPGVVEIPALGTPLTALIAAGGPTKDGSLRKILLSHPSGNDESPSIVDLYGFLRGQADLVKIQTLQDGDTIQVPPVGPTVGIAGYVQQPGIYEITTSEFTVGDALELAGGLTPFSFTPLAHLERTVDGRGRQSIDVELSAEGILQPMKNGELLLVEAVDDERQPVVRIEGEVARPGDFEHRPGMTLSELISRADGLTVEAYLPQAFISRQLGESSTVETIPDRTGHLQTRRVLVVELGKALSGDSDHDIQLMPLDLVTVRSQSKAQVRSTVEIIGSVQRPGKYELTAGMRVSDLVAIAGNPTPDVYYDEAELIRRVLDAETRRLDVKRFRFDLRQALSATGPRMSAANPLLSSGDRLVVRALQQAQVRVRIDGRVRFPGEYIFPAGAKLTDLMTAAGGILTDADLRAAVFVRESTKQLQQQRLDHLTERTRRLAENAFEGMVQTGHSGEGLAAKVALDQTQSTLGRMRNVEADGRIVIPFDSPDFPSSRYNLPLESGDSLMVPRYHSTVSVAGQVFRPITLVAGASITVEEALEQAGGLTEFADEDLLYVVRADGRVDSVAQKPSRLKKSTELLAGDVLLVPSRPMERTFGAQLADALILARQMAEVALVSSQVGKPIDMTLVSPFNSGTSSPDPAILKD